MPVRASQTPALVAPTEPAFVTLLTPVVTQTSPPLEQDGTPTPGATPTAAGAVSLVAQYDPWSLGHAVTWSSDGKILAGSAGERIYLYTGEALQEAGEIDTGTWAVSLAFNPQNAHMLALAGRDGALQIWDVSRLERLAYLPAHPKGANSVAFSPDGLSLASTGNDALRTGRRSAP